MEAAKAAIVLDGLTKYFGAVRGVEDLHLVVQPGEVFGFLGPNGAGKTTTIRLLMGFLRPSRGHGFVFGRDIGKESTAIRRDVGFLPGLVAPYEQMTGQEVLDYLGRLQGRPPVLRNELAQRLELSRPDLGRKLRDYSKGMKQKVSIIQALQHNPRLLLLDEPTEGLDPLMQNEFFEVLAERRRQGTTVFMSSHVLSEVERSCERVAIIREGRLVAVERVSELRGKGSLRVEIRLRAGADAARLLRLTDATLLSRDGRHFVLSYTGDLQRLLRALAGLQLEDLTIERPSLEEVFLAFYGDGQQS